MTPTCSGVIFWSIKLSACVVRISWSQTMMPSFFQDWKIRAVALSMFQQMPAWTLKSRRRRLMGCTLIAFFVMFHAVGMVPFAKLQTSGENGMTHLLCIRFLKRSPWTWCRGLVCVSFMLQILHRIIYCIVSCKLYGEYLTKLVLVGT